MLVYSSSYCIMWNVARSCFIWFWCDFQWTWLALAWVRCKHSQPFHSLVLESSRRILSQVSFPRDKALNHVILTIIAFQRQLTHVLLSDAHLVNICGRLLTRQASYSISNVLCLPFDHGHFTVEYVRSSFISLGPDDTGKLNKE